MRTILIFSFLICFPGIFAQKPANKATELIDQMIEVNKNVKTISLKTIMRERIKGKMVDKNTYFKINVTPRKVYLKQSFIGIKLEGLYLEGVDNDKLLISTIGFPWFHKSIDPCGSLARDKHHHTLLGAGFGYFVSVVSSLKEMNLANYENICSYQGIIVKDKRQCHKITFENTAFNYTYYTVKDNEKLPDIALKLKINDYMIIEKNSAIHSFTDVKAGQKIIVPNTYAKRMVLYLDTELLLPISIEVYDDQGLYAEYLYSDLKVNPTFKANEFDIDYPEYHFR